MNFCNKCGNKINNNDNYCNNCGNYIVVNTNEQQNIINNKNELDFNIKKSRKKAILSFILAIIPIILIGYCYLVSGGDFNENSDGAIWWYVIMYYCSIGIPIAICSIYLALESNKLKKNLLAKINIFIASLPFSLLALIYIYYGIIITMSQSFQYIDIIIVIAVVFLVATFSKLLSNKK